MDFVIEMETEISETPNIIIIIIIVIITKT